VKRREFVALAAGKVKNARLILGSGFRKAKLSSGCKYFFRVVPSAVEIQGDLAFRLAM